MSERSYHGATPRSLHLAPLIKFKSHVSIGTVLTPVRAFVFRMARHRLQLRGGRGRPRVRSPGVGHDRRSHVRLQLSRPG